MEHYAVPSISLAHFSESDLAKLYGKDRDPSEICCMRDPRDSTNGFFLWIDEEGDPPTGYSETFVKLWQWLQRKGYTWVRVADWGDVIAGLETLKRSAIATTTGREPQSERMPSQSKGAR
jgi:hypothetical protein